MCIAAEQRRYVREVSSSTVFASMCGTDAEADADAEAERGAEAAAEALSPPERRPPSGACSTPISKDL